MIELSVSQDLVIKGLEKKYIEHIKKTLTLDNPLYYKLMRASGYRAKAFYGTPQYFKYYKEEADGSLIVPRGMFERVVYFLEKCGISFDVKKDFVEVDSGMELVFKGELRDYQKDVVEKATMSGGGMIVMSTGSGKTITCLEVAARLGMTTTILTPNTVLQEQWVNECTQLFNYTPGIINAKTKEIKPITISTFGSLIKNKILLADLVKNTSILIVDEAHGAVTDKRLQIIRSFKPAYVFGCTATPAREDGKTDVIGFAFGNTVAEFHMQQLHPVVEIYLTDSVIEVDEYPAMIEFMVEDKSRNNLISGIATGEVMSGRKVLVLTKRRVHAATLAQKIPGAVLIDSDDPNRNQTLHKLKKGELPFVCIVGTTSLLATGMDIPSLDTLVLACDMKSQILTTQSVGRILRLFEGKQHPKIIDFLDGYCRQDDGTYGINNGILFRQFKERFSVYKAKNWQVDNLPKWMYEKFMR